MATTGEVIEYFAIALGVLSVIVLIALFAVSEEGDYVIVVDGEEIHCSKGASSYCGFRLSQCDDGLRYSCATNVVVN